MEVAKLQSNIPVFWSADARNLNLRSSKMDKRLLIELLPKSLPGGNVVLGESARGLLLKEVVLGQ